MSACAVFDLDGTIIDSSSERLFFFYLLKRGKLRLGSLAEWLIDWIRLFDFQKGAANKVYLKGIDAKSLIDEARTFFADYLVSRISSHACELIEFHKSHGRMVVILSGSLTVLVTQFAEHFALETKFGNDLEVVAGEITGRLAGYHPYGQQKATLVESLSSEHQLDLSASYAYGNHHTDTYKLQLFGYPVAVNPTAKLRRIAKANGWSIEMFHGRTA